MNEPDFPDLRRLLSSRPTPAWDAIWPLLRDWLKAPVGEDRDDLGRYVEVGHFRGDGSDEVDMPVGLARDRAWFWIGFARQTPERTAVVLWYSPSVDLDAVTRRPDWHANLVLGMDFVALDAEQAKAMLESPALLGSCARSRASRRLRSRSRPRETHLLGDQSCPRACDAIARHRAHHSASAWVVSRYPAGFRCARLRVARRFPR